MFECQFVDEGEHTHKKYEYKIHKTEKLNEKITNFFALFQTGNENRRHNETTNKKL